MTHRKSFPRSAEGRNVTIWEDIRLSKKEEKEQEKLARQTNAELMQECINDAGLILKRIGMRNYQSDVIRIARELFNKRASHSVFWKDKKCREKMDLVCEQFIQQS